MIALRTVRLLTITMLLVTSLQGLSGQESSTAPQSWPLDPPPGVYTFPIELTPIAREELEYRFVDGAGTPHTAYFMPLHNGLPIDGAAGLSHTVELEVRVAGSTESARGSYTIDRAEPRDVSLDPAPGTYTEPVTIRPRVIEELVGGMDHRIYTRVQGEREFSHLAATGRTLSGARGNVRDYRVAWYAVSLSGNRSPVREFLYRVDRTNEVARRDNPVVSPVAGEYANWQLLYLDERGLSGTTFEVVGEGGEVVAAGRWHEPFIIPGNGAFTLTVESTVVQTGERIVLETSWTQSNDRPETIPSGTVRSDVTIPVPDGSYRYTVSDRSVTRSDERFLQRIAISPQPDELRPLVVRYNDFGARDSRDTRAVYIRDGRVPPPPTLVLDAPSVHVVAMNGTELSVSFTSARETPQWEPLETSRIDIASLPAAVSAVQVRSRYRGGTWSAPAALSLPPVGALTRAGETPADTINVSEGTVRFPAHSRYEVRDIAGRAIVHGYTEDAVEWVIPVGYREAWTIRTTPIDTRGRRSQMVVQEGTTVARVLPDPPVIEVNGTRVSVRQPAGTSGGAIFTQINGGGFTRYRTPLNLQRVPQARAEYTVDAYRLVDGQLSVTTTRTAVVDDRPLALPPADAEGPQILTNDAEALITFFNPHDDMVLHYELATQGVPGLPTEQSPSARTQIRVPAPDGTVTTTTVVVRGRFTERSGWTPVQQWTIVQDREPPPPPRFQPPSEGTLISDRVVITLAPPPEGTTLWYRAGDGPLQRYAGPFIVRSTDSPTDRLVVHARTRDAAGNESVTEQTIRFDTQELRSPQFALNGRPIIGTTIAVARDSIVGPTAATTDPTMWRLYPLGTTPPPFQAATEQPDLPVVALDDGGVTRYVVEGYRERPGAGRSALTRIAVTVDRRMPTVPAEPFIARAPDGRSGTATFAPRANDVLYVAATGAEEAVSFVPHDGSVAWQIPAGRDQVTLSYFTVDSAGNQSETGTITIMAPGTGTQPRFSGASDGSVFRDTVTLFVEGDGPVRYTTGDGVAPPVHQLSRRYEAPLRFSAAPGERATWQVRARAELPDGALGEEATITFTIDRQPPPAPTLAGVEPWSYYPNARSFRLIARDTTEQRDSLEASAPVEIRYRLTEVGQSTDSLPFEIYDGSDRLLPGRAGELVSYRIEAYAVDEAGNRSQQVESWEVRIDQATTYVAAQSGSDTTGAGSREAPFRSLEAALTAARESGRTTLFLAHGSYELSPALYAMNRDHDWTVVGGYSAADWTTGDRPTTITVPGTSPLTISQSLRLQDVTVRGALAVDGSDAALYLERTRHEHNGDGGRSREVAPLVSVVSGRTEAREVLVSGGAFDVGPSGEAHLTNAAADYLRVRGGSATVRESIITNVHLSAAAEVTVRESRLGGDSGDGGDVNDGGENTARIAVRTDAPVYIASGTLSVESSTVESATDVRDALALRIDAGRIALTNTSVTARGTRSAVALRASGGILAVEESELRAVGGDFAYGLVLRDTAATVSNALLAAGSDTEATTVVTSDAVVHLTDTVLVASHYATIADASEQSAEAREPGDSSLTARSNAAHQSHPFLSAIDARGGAGELRLSGTVILGAEAGSPAPGVPVPAIRIGAELVTAVEQTVFAGWSHAVEAGGRRGEWLQAGGLRSALAAGEGNRALPAAVYPGATALNWEERSPRDIATRRRELRSLVE